MDVVFSKRRYKLIITDHARLRITSRNLTDDMVVEVVQTGKVKAKSVKDRYWIYKDILGRPDNSICLSVVIEEPNIIVVTALVNWRPEP